MWPLQYFYDPQQLWVRLWPTYSRHDSNVKVKSDHGGQGNSTIRVQLWCLWFLKQCLHQMRLIRKEPKAWIEFDCSTCCGLKDDIPSETHMLKLHPHCDSIKRWRLLESG
jgi:hypothetical protein